MRFFASTFCMTLLGFVPTLVSSQEIGSSGHTAAESSVLQNGVGFGDSFESALSQFSPERIAALPSVLQDAPLAVGELPEVVVPDLGVPGQFDSLVGEDLPESESPVLGQSDSLGTPALDGREPLLDTHVVESSGDDFSTLEGGEFDFEANPPLPQTQKFGRGVQKWELPEISEQQDKSAVSSKSLPGWSDVDKPSTTKTKTAGGQRLSAPGWSDPVQAAESATWWKVLVGQPIDGTRPIVSIDSNSLVYEALQNSPRIQAISQTPLIRELQIVEADSEFDPVHYVQSQFEDRVDPVGNQLTVGNGENFLKDNIWNADAGFRKKARNGAQWELNQRLGFQNSNSNFFVPQDQGTATLALNVTQPLLRGRGKYYNESQILIAQATNGAAWQSFQADLQDELVGVMSAYWDLYLTRSIYLQKLRNVERGQKILSRLEGRKGLDSLPSQITRARSSVQTRRTELANAARDVLNAETEVRRRIADTSWMRGGSSELIPGELPSATTFEIPLEQVVYNAIEHRPEIREAMSDLRVASVQRDVSANELLPELSLLMGTYVSALRGDTGILNAFQDQFGQVKPGYSVGVNFELPYGNRAARSRLAQRQVQVRLIQAQFDEAMQNIIAESQVALRRVASAAETLRAADEAIRAARTDRKQFEKRWESFALVDGDLAEGQNPTTILDQLIDAQDRLAAAETVYVQAERELKVAEVALQRTMGTLLMTQNVSALRSFDGDTPRVDVFKGGSAVSPVVYESPVNGVLAR